MTDAELIAVKRVQLTDSKQKAIAFDSEELYPTAISEGEMVAVFKSETGFRIVPTGFVGIEEKQHTTRTAKEILEEEEQ